MNSKHNLLTAGTILLGALTVSATTFAATPLSHGYQVAEATTKVMEEQKCGANKAKEVQEQKCGANKAQPAPAPVKAKEAKCGEAKCGANKKKEG